MNWKKCNKCGFSSPDLQWDKELYAKQGIWKLALITNDNGTITKIAHECQEAAPSYNQPLLECKYCSHTHYGWFNNKSDLDNHIKQHHPNGEIRYEEYYRVTPVNDEDWVQRPCNECTKTNGYTVLHPHKYGLVKNLNVFSCIR